MLIPSRFRLVAGIVWTAVCLLGFIGCAQDKATTLDQTRREFAGWEATADVASKARPEALPEVTVETDKSGKTTTSIKPGATTEQSLKATASESTDNAATGSWYSKVSIPLSVSLLFFAIALVIFGILWWFIKRNRAVNAAWSWATDELGGAIHRVREQMANATDPSILAHLRATEADLLRRQVESLKP